MKASIFLHKIGGADTLGSLWPVLGARGFSCELVDCFDGGLEGGFDPLAPELLIVTGGSPGVYQADSYPFLRREIAVLEKRLAADLPTLGICLGAQLMAAALGARNYKGENGIERGWYDIAVNEDGMKTPLRHLDASRTKMAQLHQDTFELPQGAVLLASTPQYRNQAFSWGKNAIGVQFHPETNVRLMRNWGVLLADSAYEGRLDVAEWNAAADRYAPVLEKQAQIFMNEWLDHAGFAQARRQA